MSSFASRFKSDKEQAKRDAVAVIKTLKDSDDDTGILKKLAAAIEVLVETDGQQDDSNTNVTLLREQYKSTLSQSEKIQFNGPNGLGRRVVKIQDAYGFN